MNARRLRVLMTADTVGGVWSYALELCAALAPLEVDVALATMGALPTPAQSRAAAALGNVELFESGYALEWMPGPWREVDAAGDWLRRIAEHTAPDVVHVNGYAHAAVPFAAPILVVAHSDVCTWHRAVRGVDAPDEWSEYRRRVVRGLAAADALVAPTAAILRAVLAAHGTRANGRARVIPNGCDPARWPPATKEPFVLGAGRAWDEAKGLDVLAAAAPDIAWPVRIAGPPVPPLGVHAAELRGVEMLGALEPGALAGWMARAAIYALPARYEPFGLSIVEAALAGCALVIGNLDTLREVWADAAVYVPPGDARALAAAMSWLTGDAHLRTALGHRARARALTLSPAMMAAAYRGLYDDLCATALAPTAAASQEARA